MSNGSVRGSRHSHFETQRCNPAVRRRRRRRGIKVSEAEGGKHLRSRRRQTDQPNPQTDAVRRCPQRRVCSRRLLGRSRQESELCEINASELMPQVHKNNHLSIIHIIISIINIIILYLLLLPFRYGSRLPQCGDATLCQCGIVAKANAVPLWQCASGARASCKHGAPVAAYGLALAFATMPRCHNVLVPHCRNRLPYP